MLVHRNRKRIGIGPSGGHAGEWVREDQIRQLQCGCRSSQSRIAREGRAALGLCSLSHRKPGVVDLRREVQTVCSAQHGLRMRLPSEAKARLEIVIHGLYETSAVR